MKDNKVLETRIDDKGNECEIISKVDTGDGYEDMTELVHRIGKDGKDKIEERKVQRCKHCGEVYIYYNESLFKTLINKLVILYKANGPVEIKSSTYTNSEYNNFQKLKYFELAYRVSQGVWCITELGKRFMRGDAPCARRVVHLRNKIVERGEPIFIYQIKGLPYVYEKEYYSDQAKEQIANAENF